MSTHNKDSHTHTLTHTDSNLARLQTPGRSDGGQDIPIFTKTYEFYKNIYQVLKVFPKRDRYSLGQKIENIILEIFELLFTLNSLDKTQKIEVLQKINTKVDLEKVMLRLAKDNNCIDSKKYLSLQENLQEIGRMTGGWIRYLKNP